MEFSSRVPYGYFPAVVFLLCSSMVFGGDIVHQDDIAPKKPGCDNNFVLVNLSLSLKFKDFTFLHFFH